jgi:hypothetical protein
VLYPGPPDAFVSHHLPLESERILTFSDWFPLTAVGLTFGLLGSVRHKDRHSKEQPQMLPAEHFE